ncbi:hypothetical protein Tco_0649703, partial [Tanacetum coccineum]
QKDAFLKFRIFDLQPNEMRMLRHPSLFFSFCHSAATWLVSFAEYGDPKDFGEFDEIESPEEIPDIYPVGDPREFFDFYDVNYKPTTKTIEFTDQIGNPTKFAVLPPSEELYRKETPVDSNGNKIDTKKGIEENHKDLWCVFDARMVLENELKNVSVLFLGMWKSSATHHIEVEKFDFNASLEHMPCEVL